MCVMCVYVCVCLHVSMCVCVCVHIYIQSGHMLASEGLQKLVKKYAKQSEDEAKLLGATSKDEVSAADAAPEQKMDKL